MTATILRDIVLEYGVPTMMTIALLVILYRLIKNTSEISMSIIENTAALRDLRNAVGQPYLDLDKAGIVFESLMIEHINMKLHYIGDVLEKNDIHNRRAVLEKNIETAFKQITRKEVAKLSKFRTAAGDMGQILECKLDWDKFLGDCFEIIFDTDYSKRMKENNHREDDEIKLKIHDLKSLMQGYVDDIAEEIKLRGGNNEV